MSENDSSLVEYGIPAVILYHMAAFFEGYDLQIYPMCMRAFELTLGMSQSDISTVATAGTMSFLGCSMLWGLLADKFEPNFVLGSAAVLSGITSILLGCVSYFSLIIILRFLHGFAVGCISPMQQKIISASYGTCPTSTAFGVLLAMHSTGRLLSAFLTTLSAANLVIGHHGWRTCHVFMGYAWIILGVLIVRNMLPKNGRPIASVGAKSSSMWAGLTDAFKARTTIVLICVLFISDSPCVAFNYMIIYLQYCGVSNHMAGVACAVTMVGAAIGGSLGGLLVSFIDGRCKHYGLISCANVVICIRLVACSYFFFGPEPRGGLRWFHFLELAIIGATSMTAGCIDRPIMAHVMKKEFQASSWSICRCIAGVLSSSIFYPLCGYLSETVFGYIPSTDSFETMDIVVRMGNASALRKSMASLFVGGTALNIACYVAFFFTYPQDKKNRMELDEKLKQVEEKEKRETGQTAAGSAAPATVVK